MWEMTKRKAKVIKLHVGRWCNNKLEWSRVISSEADVKNLSLLDSQGVALAIETACLARQKALHATKQAHKAKQCLRQAAMNHTRGQEAVKAGNGQLANGRAKLFEKYKPES